MPEVHAKLSASGAKRWINCPPSVALETKFPSTTSKYAEEGTKAHEIAELKLTKYIRKKRKKIECEDKDMDYYTDLYRDYCVEIYNKLRKKCKDTVFLIEQRLDFSKYVPGGFGTGDCVIIADNELHIIDLKYGKGVEVEADDNPQLRLYGLGACTAFEMLYDFDTITTHVMQPRLDNISAETLSVKDLKIWAEDVVAPAAALADVGEGKFKCGDHCQFCKAKAVCKARKEYLMELEKFNYDDPSLLTIEDVQEVLTKVDELKKWAESVKEFALDQILEGKDIPGYKAVEGRSLRKYVDEEKISEALKNNGYDEAVIYEKKLLGITAMTKLLGKKDFSDLIGDLVEKPQGKPTIAPEGDKRPSLTVNDAQEDFKDLLQ
ncbi:MAG: DUF2800 domain-containing protein [Breznakia sp.]